MKEKNIDNPMLTWLDRFPPPAPGGDRDGKDLPDERPASGPREEKKMKPQAVLDLHGMTREQAGGALDQFILESHGKGLKKILIIHGKGYHSEEGAVLPKFVRELLEKNPYAGDFRTAEAKYGGSGAIMVMVRQRSR